jgi:N-carbamoyl-L-amino-acid hydrolase
VLPLAATALAARGLAERAGAVATVGRLRVVPNGTNAVPSMAEAWLDARAADEATLARLVDDVTAAAREAAGEHGVDVEPARESAAPVVDFDGVLRERIGRVLGGPPELPTSAGHDAGILAARVPTAMLFVRNPTGVSHSPAEHADRADCLAGIAALTAVAAELTR